MFGGRSHGLRPPWKEPLTQEALQQPILERGRGRLQGSGVKCSLVIRQIFQNRKRRGNRLWKPQGQNLMLRTPDIAMLWVLEGWLTSPEGFPCTEK